MTNQFTGIKVAQDKISDVFSAIDTEHSNGIRSDYPILPYPVLPYHPYFDSVRYCYCTIRTIDPHPKLSLPLIWP